MRFPIIAAALLLAGAAGAQTPTSDGAPALSQTPASSAAPGEATASGETAAPGEMAERRIIVSGEGEVATVPDMATITLGVVTENEAAAAALEANSTAMAAVMEQVTSAGIAPEDMQTSMLNLGPRWSEPTEPGQRPKIDGYTASSRLTIRVRDLAQLGGVLQAAVADGANTLDGLEFGLADSMPLMDEARHEAVEDAARKARLLAEAAGVKVGQVITIEAQQQRPVPMMMEQVAFTRDASVPVAPGEIVFRASVTMTFGID